MATVGLLNKVCMKKAEEKKRKVRSRKVMKIKHIGKLTRRLFRWPTLTVDLAFY